MLPLSVAGVILIMASAQNIVCFSPQRGQRALAAVIPGNVPSFSLQELEADASERAAYDPGEDPYKSLSSLLQSEDYSNLGTDGDLSENILLKTLESEILEDQEVAEKSAILLKLLEDPSMQTLPIVYMESDETINDDDPLFQSSIDKRSRYSRRYPWKRQNNRNKIYEADTRYPCVPTREDVFKLLVGIHENRQKMVSFCNRKRPAKAIFTNIRLLG